MTENLKRRLVTTSEIAVLAGVDASTVSNWRRRFDGTFPQPALTDDEGKRPKFDRAEITEWLRQNPQVGGRPSDTRSDLYRVLDRVRGLATPDSHAEIIGQLLESIERDRREGRDHAARNFADIEALLDEDRLSGGLLRTLLVEEDLVATYEYLLAVPDPLAFYDEVLAVGQNRLSDASEKTSPPALVDFLTALAPTRTGGFVIDPVAGYGALLLSCLRQGKASFGLGVDINIEAVTIANRRFFLAKADETRSEVGNSLVGDVLGSVRGDLVVADPPLGLMWKPATADEKPIDWDFGTPKSSNADMAWLQIAISHLLPGGTAIVVTSLGTLFQSDRATAQIRNEMVRRGAVQAIFTLPAKVRTNTAVRLAVWVLTTPDRADRRTNVLLVDLGANDAKSLDPHGAGAHMFRQWMADERAALDPTFAVSVPVTDLLAPDATLLPSRWNTIEEESRGASDWIQRVETSYQAAEQALNGQFKLPKITAALNQMTPDTLTISDLTKRGSISVLRGRHTERHHGSGESYPVLSVREARNLRPDQDSASDRAEAISSTTSQLVLPGDVLVYPDGDDVVARVWTEPGWVLGRFMQAIRILDDSWNAHYLAAALNSPTNARHILGGISRTHFNLPEFTVVAQGASDQRLAQLIDERFAALAAHLAESSAAVEKAKTEILNALATGLVKATVQQHGGTAAG
jgi:predicted DNA-binding transcriptional regulator AlpA